MQGDNAGMTTLKRSSFLAQTQGRAIPLDTAQAEPSLSNVKLSEADLNHDGQIAGRGEMDQLFNAIDDLDHNGSRASILAQTQDGVDTPAGAAARKLLGLAKRITQLDTQNRMSDNAGLRSLGDRMAEGGKASIQNSTQGHLDAIDKTGVGLFYGDHSGYKQASPAQREAYLQSIAKPDATIPKPEESSCITWAMRHVKAAYTAAGKTQRWNQIAKTVYQNGTKGTDLAKELQKDGWSAVYFNPDPAKNADGNSEHSYSAAMVKRGKPYYGVKVDDQVLNYRPAPGSSTQSDTAGLDKLADTRFWFGLARGGQHTFVGHGDTVNEFHWDRNPGDRDAIEERKLADFPWLSGLIMVPPGDWPN